MLEEKAEVLKTITPGERDKRLRVLLVFVLVLIVLTISFFLFARPMYLRSACKNEAKEGSLVKYKSSLGEYNTAKYDNLYKQCLIKNDL